MGPSNITQVSTQSYQAEVVVIELLSSVGFHVFEQVAVLFKHCPVAGLEPIAVQESPHVTLPSLDPADAPEEHRGQRLTIGSGWRVHTDDAKLWRRPAGRRVWDLKPHPHEIGVPKLGPVEVQTPLPVLGEDITGLGLGCAELGDAGSLGHRVGHSVQERSVCRIHHVVGDISVVTFPLHVTKEVAALLGGQLLWKHKLWRRVEMRIDAVVEKDGTRGLGCVEHPGRSPTIEPTTRASRYVHDHAIVAELDRGALIAATATSMALLLGTVKGTAGRVTVATITTCITYLISQRKRSQRR